MASSHPYFPLDASIPNYTANESPLIHILAIFGALTTAVVGSAYLLSCRASSQPLRSIDRFAVCWFALCGFLHITFEGYFIYHQSAIPALQSTYAQLWKEYCLSDSRYLTLDVFTVCVETITVFCWGPLSCLAAVSILRRWHSRHFYQIIVCTAHLYGVALYYATNWADFRTSGVSYSRPEFLYYWVYYVGFNMPWAVVPFVLLYDSWESISAAFAALQRQEALKKGR